MAQYGRELVSQLVDNPEYLRASDASVPPQYNVPNEAPLPMFVQVDFGVVRNASGELEPKLVELQAFPSLYGYQQLSAQQYIESYDLSRDLGIYLCGHDRDSYWKLMRELIVADHDPENVILMEIDPDHQKTLPDFLVTQRELGIAIVDILSLKKRGDKLFYAKDGREIEVRRIYNRCIVDELERKAVTLPFDLRDELDVEWAGHPNWYFRISKFSIPHLKHPCVPKTSSSTRSAPYRSITRITCSSRCTRSPEWESSLRPRRPTLMPSRWISATTTSCRSGCTLSRSSRRRTGRRRWRFA